MKKIILSIALLSSSICFSQLIERNKLATGKALDFKIEQRIKDKTDTMTYFYWSFQNMKYQSITDLASIMITDSTDLRLFADKLTEIAAAEAGSNISITVGKHCVLSLHDFSVNNLYIDVNGKYTIIPKKKVLLIAEEIKKYSYLLN